MTNQFTQALGQKNTITWNDAVSNSTSGDLILDYFAKCGSFRGRSQSEVDASMGAIFGTDPLLAMKTVLYNRMITRRVRGFTETEKVQRGQGQKDEFVKSLIWLERNYPNLLYNNLWIVPAVGSWKDLWYDSPATKLWHYVNPQQVYQLIEKGLADPYHRALIAKYLPKIRSRRNAKTERHKRLNVWARNLCTHLEWTERDYRKFKSNPENSAHLFQRLMCSSLWDKLDFKAIPGRALFNLTNRKGKDGESFLSRHSLEDKYIDWIQKQPVAKFTGYPYELYQKAKSNRNLAQTYTLNAQFETLIQTAMKDINPDILKKGVLCALDTSGSMSSSYWSVDPNGPAPIDICVGLGLFFSRMLQGAFADHVIMFDNHSRFLKLKGTFCERADQIPSNAMGGTNFQSVIDEIVRVRHQSPNIPIEDFPEVLLVVSDMQFNPTNNNTTNYQRAMTKLSVVGLPPISIIWWQVNGRFTGDVPSTMFDPGTTLISGFDGSIVTALLGAPDKVVDEKTGEVRKTTPYEKMLACLDQEILNSVK